MGAGLIGVLGYLFILGSGKFYRTWFSFINIGMFSVFNFCQFTVLTSFLCFRNKDKLIKLRVFLEV